jgi:MFS family permease
MLRALNIGLSDHTAMLLYITFYIIYTIFTIPAGMISDKIGRKPVIGIGYVLFGLTSLGLVFVSSLFQIAWVFVLYGVFYAMIDGVQRAFVVDLSPPDLKATALGTFHTATGLAALPAGVIAGLLWDTISPETAFVYGFVLSLVAAASLLKLKI